MIRGNWSLSNDLRNQQRKKQLKIHQKQKNDHKLQKLTQIDPIRLYNKIQRLKNQQLNERDSKHLRDLQDDWSFIEKNGLHQEILQPFFAKLKAKEIEQTKKLGSKSIYFNPELNPLGKVPKNMVNSQRMFPNYTKPLKTYQKYTKDPEIDKLNVVLPQGEPPKFYKLVQNIENDHIILIEGEESTSTIEKFVPVNVLKRRKEKPSETIVDNELNESSDNEYYKQSSLAPEEEEFEQISKKTKI